MFTNTHILATPCVIRVTFFTFLVQIDSKKKKNRRNGTQKTRVTLHLINWMAIQNEFVLHNLAETKFSFNRIMLLWM